MTEAARVIADRVPFLPGTGSARLDETLQLTAAAFELGADAALVITPYYARPTQEGLYQWYATVAGQNPDLPIVVYNVPSRTGHRPGPRPLVLGGCLTSGETRGRPPSSIRYWNQRWARTDSASARPGPAAPVPDR